MITSTTNQQVKYIEQLQKKRSLRKKDGVFIAEGIKMVMETPKNMCVKVYFSKTYFDEIKNNPTVLDWLKGREYEILSDHVFESCAQTQTPQGVMAIVKQKVYSPDDFTKGSFYLVLDGIQDPGNLGTIMRTSEAAGVEGIIMSADTVDLYNPKVVRSTMGAIFRVPFLYVEDIPAFIEKQKKAGIYVYATALEDSLDYAVCDYKKPVCLVIGNEANGVRENTKAACHQMIHIPMLGNLESLNAAVAAAVVSFEVNRQRRIKN